MFRIEYNDGRRGTAPDWPSDETGIRSITRICMPALNHLHDEHRFLERLRILRENDDLASAIALLTSVAAVQPADARYLVSTL